VLQNQERFDGRIADVLVHVLPLDQRFQGRWVAIVDRAENLAEPFGHGIAIKIERHFARSAEDLDRQRVGTLFPELGQQKERKDVEHVVLALRANATGSSAQVSSTLSNSGVIASRCSTAARIAFIGNRPV
jgi:hypothetical protein